MPMRQRRMRVTMGMGLTRRHTRRMFVLMMFVVCVTMLMHKGLVGVSMCVTIGEEPDRAADHERSGDSRRGRHGIAEDNDGDNRSRERCRGKQGRFAGCAQQPQRVGVQQDGSRRS